MVASEITGLEVLEEEVLLLLEVLPPVGLVRSTAITSASMSSKSASV
jgi:hypothetical protein